MEYDLVIKGATVVDGSGAPSARLDVAINEGRISDIGKLDGSARELIDADGLYLAPGIVDIHTHYDAQVAWDPSLSPSSGLGVTTVVMGNCGFGIAPARPEQRQTLIENLSVVEAMDLGALNAGLNFEFSNFREYVSFLQKQAPYLNAAVLIGHSAVRLDVMGDEASQREVPTAAELEKMRETVRAAIRDGAIGFSSSFSPNHRGYGGVPMPSTIAGEAELRALVGVLGEEGKGVFQIAAGERASVEMLESISADTGRLITMSGGMTLYKESAPSQSSDTLNACGAALQRGHRVYGQVSCQPLSIEFTPDEPYIFYAYPAFSGVQNADRERLRQCYADASFRDAFRQQLKTPNAAAAFSGNWERIVVAEVAKAENHAIALMSITDIASQRGCDAIDAFFDVCLEDDMQTMFVGLLFNAVDEGVLPLIKHEAGLIALSDAGAHLGVLCDAGYGLHLLGHWVRERGDFEMAEGVRRLTSQPADLYGITDRGRIAKGACADLMLFDADTVGISGLIRRNDLPTGASRLVREATGMHGLWVNGVRVADEQGVIELARGPGQVLRQFQQ
jgi:N-acyl-D-amino-acid deacylase